MTIASALDHLTDVLANKDVAGYQTIEQSINNISDMITDGEITIGGSISPATADTLGGVKIGEGISVTSDGTISASGGGGYDLVVKLDASDLSDVTTATLESGTYSAAIANAANGKPLTALVYGVSLTPDSEIVDMSTFYSDIFIDIFDEDQPISIYPHATNITGIITILSGSITYKLDN